jgi:hypothetical protein
MALSEDGKASESSTVAPSSSSVAPVQPGTPVSTLACDDTACNARVTAMPVVIWYAGRGWCAWQRRWCPCGCGRPLVCRGHHRGTCCDPGSFFDWHIGRLGRPWR